MIYAIRAVGTDYIKFGHAVDVQTRLDTLQIGCPFELELVAACDGDHRTETWIHWRLCKAKAWHRGEWFKDCEEVKKIIFEMLADDLKPDGSPSDQVTINNKRLGAVLELAKRKPRGWAIKERLDGKRTRRAARST